jgi:hypothetical protein
MSKSMEELSVKPKALKKDDNVSEEACRYQTDIIIYLKLTRSALALAMISSHDCSVLVEDDCDKICDGGWKERPYAWNPVG